MARRRWRGEIWRRWLLMSYAIRWPYSYAIIAVEGRAATARLSRATHIVTYVRQR